MYTINQLPGVPWMWVKSNAWGKEEGKVCVNNGTPPWANMFVRDIESVNQTFLVISFGRHCPAQLPIDTQNRSLSKM